MNTRRSTRRSRQCQKEEEVEKPKGPTIKDIQEEEEPGSNDTAYNNNNNPMMNDVILKHLFEVVSHRELSTFRQVSKKWYKLSLPSWLKNGRPMRLNDSSFKRFVLKGVAISRNRKLRDMAGAHQRYPKFRLWFYGYEEKVHDLFWERHGEWLTHLTLHYNRVPGVVRFLNVLTCKFTPKLEYLEVECTTFNNSNTEEEEEVVQRGMPTEELVVTENKNLREFRIDYHDLTPLPMDWETLLSHYPKLEHFSIGKALSGTRSSQLGDILRAIKRIRSGDMDKLNLKSLNCFYKKSYRELDPDDHDKWDPLPTSVPEDLRLAKLQKLETFRVDFCHGEPDVVINSILSTFASSLKKLEFYRFALVPNLPFRAMVKLRCLTVSGYPIGNLLFLADLPNLHSLTLWGDLREDVTYAHTRIADTHRPGLAFPSLTQFHCNYEVEWTEEDLHQLRDLMPNLTQLEMYLDNSTFRQVCQYWPRLEHLSVFGGGIGDVGLVGLDKNGPDEFVYNQPNITNLTELKSFAMENLGKLTSFLKRDFSEHSVLAGFVNLRHLKRLVITTNKIDMDVAKLLLMNIPFAKVTSGGGLGNQDSFELRRRIRKEQL